MIPALVLVMSVGALGQFGLAYCRSLLAAYGELELSRQTQDGIAPMVTGFAAGEFDRLLGLIRFAPQAVGMRELRVVSCYYRVLAAAKWAVAPVSQAISKKIESELSRCTYMAAVTLDLSLAPSRN